MEGKDAITMDRFVFMIDKEVEILAKQCTSHLKPSDTFPSGKTGAFEFSVTRGQSKCWAAPPPHDPHTHLLSSSVTRDDK